MRRRGVAAAVAVTGLLLTACGSETKEAVPASPASEGTPSASPSATPTVEPTAAAVDPAGVKANELGKVPVMMYHQVKVDAHDAYDQTPDDFRKELERLYKDDYRPVTARDFIAGKIDIPAGKHAVVMTFDDSSVSQAQIGADGNPTADSALGIMEKFAKDYPDWKSTATFYVNTEPAPFNDAKVMPWLVEHGYEVGSHTITHANLKNLSESGALKEIGGNVRDIQAALPGYTVTTFARPFGIAPANLQLLHGGTYESTTYKFDGVMLVGSDPNKSPFNADFDPFAIHRIRSGSKTKPVDMDATYWMASLEAGPSSVYTSDGDPDKISYPATSTIKIADKYKDKANAYSATSSSSGSSSSGSSSSGSSSSGSSGTGTMTGMPTTEPTTMPPASATPTS